MFEYFQFFRKFFLNSVDRIPPSGHYIVNGVRRFGDGIGAVGDLLPCGSLLHRLPAPSSIFVFDKGGRGEIQENLPGSILAEAEGKVVLLAIWARLSRPWTQ